MQLNLGEELRLEVLHPQAELMTGTASDIQTRWPWRR
jgi:hypothetical protein